jgi:glycosyltransferase involved in cell wall biosynthesis
MIQKLLPINIILTSYNRKEFLKKTITEINSRTRYPYKLFVVDNASTDGSIAYLKNAKVMGEIFDHLFLDKNEGQSVALNHAFQWMVEWEKRRKSDNLFLTTNDDIVPPLLNDGPCWLERQKHIFEKYGESENIGGLCHRIERTSRVDINEEKELIRLHKNLPSVFRMLRRDDFEKLGDKPFGILKHFDSNTMGSTMKENLKKYFYMTTKIYSSHIGYEVENKGYAIEDKEYFTYSGEDKLQVFKEKPYPIIDEKSNIPLKITSQTDLHEQNKREEYFEKYSDTKDTEEILQKREIEKQELLKYLLSGNIIEVGCGKKKIKPDITGIDIYPYECVDIVEKGDDLWWIKDCEIDGIVSSYFVDRIADTKKLLKEWNRVLKVGGIMSFICQNADYSQYYILEENNRAVITKEILKRILIDLLGHEIVKLENLPSGKIICISKKI